MRLVKEIGGLGRRAPGRPPARRLLRAPDGSARALPHPVPATVIAERIEWAHGITVLKGRVAELRPVYLPPDPGVADLL